MAGFKIGRMVLSVCATNCYFVYREGENKVIVFDPADQGELIYNSLKNNGFEVDTILITHGHFDHIWGAQKLRALSGAKAYALDKEEELLLSSDLNASEMAGRACAFKCNGFFKDGEVLDILGFKIKVIATPGHTKGSCCFYFEEDDVLITGDTLFEESVGRTDLPTGNGGDLLRSLREKLSPLPDKVVCYPGHGDATTIGHEKEYNPFWN